MNNALGDPASLSALEKAVAGLGATTRQLQQQLQQPREGVPAAGKGPTMNNSPGEISPLQQELNRRADDRLRPVFRQQPEPTSQDLIARGLGDSHAERDAATGTQAATGTPDAREAFIAENLGGLPSGLRGFIGNDPLRWRDEAHEARLTYRLNQGEKLSPVELMTLGVVGSRSARP